MNIEFLLKCRLTFFATFYYIFSLLTDFFSMVRTGKSQSKITSYIMKSICLISIFYKKACVSTRYDEKILVVCQKKSRINHIHWCWRGTIWLTTSVNNDSVRIILHSVWSADFPLSHLCGNTVTHKHTHTTMCMWKVLVNIWVCNDFLIRPWTFHRT